MKAILNKLGRAFVILTHEEVKTLNNSVLILDNGYSSHEHLLSIVVEAKRRIVGSDISVLTFEDRGNFLRRNFSDIEIIHPDNCAKIKRHRLPFYMLKLRKRRFDFIILMSLEVTPIMLSLLFMRARLLLYSRWNEWFLLRFRNLWELITAKRGVDKVRLNSGKSASALLMLITHLFVFLYLLAFIIFISLRRLYYALKFNFVRKVLAQP